MALSKRYVPKIKGETTTIKSFSKLNPEIQSIPQVSLKPHEQVESEKLTNIIGWYCRKCTILHKPTQSCPVTNLRMGASGDLEDE